MQFLAKVLDQEEHLLILQQECLRLFYNPNSVGLVFAWLMAFKNVFKDIFKKNRKILKSVGQYLGFSCCQCILKHLVILFPKYSFTHVCYLLFKGGTDTSFKKLSSFLLLSCTVFGNNVLQKSSRVLFIKFCSVISLYLYFLAF